MISKTIGFRGLAYFQTHPFSAGMKAKCLSLNDMPISDLAEADGTWSMVIPADEHPKIDPTVKLTSGFP